MAAALRCEIFPADQRRPVTGVDLVLDLDEEYARVTAAGWPLAGANGR